MRLALGTVQFGMEYGVSNVYGQTMENEVKQILVSAYDHGICMLDSATSYGLAEKVVGQAIIDGEITSAKWKIVTKTPSFKVQRITGKQVEELEVAFETSCNKLNRKTFYGLLIHNCDDLFASDGTKLFESLQQFKECGLVEKIGVSLYSSEQVDRVLDEFPIDLVQLPVNILDQRLLKNGRLAKLKRYGVEIHARSVFLQGLLLMNLVDVAEWFKPIRNTLGMFHQLACEKGLTPLELALGFVQGIHDIDRVVVGVNTLDQLIEIVNAAEIELAPSDYSGLSISDPVFMNPVNWKL